VLVEAKNGAEGSEGVRRVGFRIGMSAAGRTSSSLLFFTSAVLEREDAF